jgi:hypothetical protein
MRVQVDEHSPSLSHDGTGGWMFLMYVHVTSLRDKAEDAAVLFVKGPHVRGVSAARGGELTGECLLCDFWQIAKATLTILGQWPIANAGTGEHQAKP